MLQYRSRFKLSAQAIELEARDPLDPLLLIGGVCICICTAQGAIKKSEALTVCLLAVVVACFLVDLMVSKPPVSKLVG